MKVFLRESVISVIISIILILGISLVITFTQVNENFIMPLTIGATALSLMIGAYRISKNKKEKGILYGTCLGIVYMLILYIISVFISSDFSLSLNSLIMIIVGIIGGAVGGIIGVNF